MSDFKHMINEEDIGSGEQAAAEKEELNKEIQKIPVNGGAPGVPEGQPDDMDAENSAAQKNDKQTDTAP